MAYENVAEAVEKLVDALISRWRPMRTANVVAVSGNRVTLMFAKDPDNLASGVPFMDTYSPAAGDVVKVWSHAGDIFVLGKVRAG
jgi:hypothetical protein